MVLAIDEQGAVGATLAEGEIVDRQDPGWVSLGNRDCAGEAQEGIRAGWHRLAVALTRARFTAKCQAQVLQHRGQAKRTLSRRGDQVGQGFGEGLGSARRIETTPASHVQQQVHGQANKREITWPTAVVAMDGGRVSGTVGAACRQMRCSCGKRDRAAMGVQIKDGQTRKQKGQWVLSGHGKRSSISSYENL